MIVPGPSDDDLRAHAEELRDLLRRGQAPSATLARWERIATAIECGEIKATPHMGRPKKPERLEVARHAYRLRREGLSWLEVYSQLADSRLLPKDFDGDAVRKAVEEFKNILIAEELDGSLDKNWK